MGLPAGLHGIAFQLPASKRRFCTGKRFLKRFQTPWKLWKTMQKHIKTIKNTWKYQKIWKFEKKLKILKGGELCGENTIIPKLVLYCFGIIRKYNSWYRGFGIGIVPNEKQNAELLRFATIFGGFRSDFPSNFNFANESEVKAMSYTFPSSLRSTSYRCTFAVPVSNALADGSDSEMSFLHHGWHVFCQCMSQIMSAAHICAISQQENSLQTMTNKRPKVKIFM